MRYLIALVTLLWSGTTHLHASEVIAWAGTPVDVVVLGEIHDNPAHHTRQAEIVAELAPRAVIFEMLTAGEAAALADIPRDAEAMRAAVDGFHWSNIADYAALLAVPEGVIIGAAVPRADVRRAFSEGAAPVFGLDAMRFGLTAPVPEAELERRKQLQFDAHCAAMPMEMMGGMVEAQRLRDAAFARTVLDALQDHGAPVVLITGNGHARKDWGVPAFLAAAAPDVSVITIGQSEGGQSPSGGFDAVFDAPVVSRPDPCAAFE